MHSLITFGWIVVTGFICAGFSHAVYQLVTNKVMSFDVSKETGVGMFVSLITLIFAGPFVLVRNSVRGFRIENRNGGWVAASTAISILWSFISGAFLLNVYITALV